MVHVYESHCIRRRVCTVLFPTPAAGTLSRKTQVQEHIRTCFDLVNLFYCNSPQQPRNPSSIKDLVWKNNTKSLSLWLCQKCAKSFLFLQPQQQRPGKGKWRQQIFGTKDESQWIVGQSLLSHVQYPVPFKSSAKDLSPPIFGIIMEATPN